MANFYPAILANLCENVEVIPAVSQVELHPFFMQAAALENMREEGIYKRFVQSRELAAGWKL